MPEPTVSSSASFFAQVSQDLIGVGEGTPTLRSVVERAVEVVPACDWASVTLRRRRNRTETVVCTSDIARRVDQLQNDLGEGPCLEQASGGGPRLANRLETSEEWPRWGPRAAQLGVHALIGIELVAADEVLGALNFYSGTPAAFTPEDVDLADVYAAHATNALTAARMASELRTALHSRHLIGVAQGILMQRHQLNLDQAFELLRRCSGHLDIKLSEVAEHVATHGELPSSDGKPC